MKRSEKSQGPSRSKSSGTFWSPTFSWIRTKRGGRRECGETYLVRIDPQPYTQAYLKGLRCQLQRAGVGESGLPRDVWDPSAVAGRQTSHSGQQQLVEQAARTSALVSGASAPQAAFVLALAALDHLDDRVLVEAGQAADSEARGELQQSTDPKAQKKLETIWGQVSRAGCHQADLLVFSNPDQGLAMAGFETTMLHESLASDLHGARLAAAHEQGHLVAGHLLGQLSLLTLHSLLGGDNPVAKGLLGPWSQWSHGNELEADEHALKVALRLNSDPTEMMMVLFDSRQGDSHPDGGLRAAHLMERLRKAWPPHADKFLETARHRTAASRVKLMGALGRLEKPEQDLLKGEVERLRRLDSGQSDEHLIGQATQTVFEGSDLSQLADIFLHRSRALALVEESHRSKPV